MNPSLIEPVLIHRYPMSLFWGLFDFVGSILLDELKIF
ncbi:hypothetical protein LEWO105114_05065 [Legionella worsleiensis]|nr:Uncharacterised protein [Legionella worsleiensis]